MIGVMISPMGFLYVVADMAVIVHIAFHRQPQIDRADLVPGFVAEYVIINRRHTIVRRFFIHAVAFFQIDDLAFCDLLAFEKVQYTHNRIIQLKKPSEEGLKDY